MKKFNKNTAFSLIELSIVILIIGILIVGITKGSRIMTEAKLKSARSLTINSPVSTIYGIVAWFETTLPSSFTNNIKDGDSVFNWYDNNPHSTSKNNATGFTSTQFFINKINGLPGVYTNGSDSSAISFGGADLVGKDYTVFIVENKIDQTEGCFLGGLGTDDNSALNLCYSSDGGDTILFSQKNNDIKYQNSSLLSLSSKIHSFHFNQVSGKKYYLNNTLQTPSSTSGSAYNDQSPLVSFANTRLGKSVSTESAFKGYLGEVIIFNKAVTESERKSVTEYLSQKWGIKISGS